MSTIDPVRQWEKEREVRDGLYDKAIEHVIFEDDGVSHWCMDTIYATETIDNLIFAGVPGRLTDEQIVTQVKKAWAQFSVYAEKRIADQQDKMLPAALAAMYDDEDES